MQVSLLKPRAIDVCIEKMEKMYSLGLRKAPNEYIFLFFENVLVDCFAVEGGR